MTRREMGLLGCGVAIAAAMWMLAAIDGRARSDWFLAGVAGAALGYAGALILLRGGGHLSPRAFAVAILVAVAARAPLVPVSPLVSDDVYRYVWDARAQRAGYNPFDVRPADPALEHLHTPATRRIDRENAQLPTIYPPVAQIFFRVVTAFGESALSFALAALLCDLALGWMVFRWLAAAGRNPHLVLAYAWNPLVVIEGVGGGHLDILGALLLAATAFALARGWLIGGSTAWAASVGLKFLPIVLLPLVWAKLTWRGLALAAAVLAAVYVPFALSGEAPPWGSLGDYLSRWRFNGPLFRWLQPRLGETAALAIAPLGGMTVAFLLRGRREAPAAWAWPMAATLVLCPTVYPWYLVWLTPFLVDRGTAALAAWTMTSLTTYSVWASEMRGAGWVLPAWVVPFEYGVVAAIGLWQISRWMVASRMGRTLEPAAYRVKWID